VHGFALVEWREHKKVSEEEEDYMSKNSVLWNVVLWRITCSFWSLSTALWIQNAIAHVPTGLHDIVPFTRILQSSKYAPLNPKPNTPHMQLHFSRVTNPIMYYYPPIMLVANSGMKPHFMQVMMLQHNAPQSRTCHLHIPFPLLHQKPK
jgi:hypothetical protein